MKKFEQRMILVLADDGKGNMDIKVDFHPQLATSQENFNKLSPNRQQLEMMAAQIGKAIMSNLSKGIAEQTGVQPDTGEAENALQPEGHAAAGIAPEQQAVS